MSYDEHRTSSGPEIGEETRHRPRARRDGKLPVRERLALLLDEGSLVEDGRLANQDPQLPGDGVVTGLGKIDGRTVAVMANDPAVKAGSWGRLTVEKILRLLETARQLSCPLVYLVDSAGARITEQLTMFPGRRGAGHIFHLQVELSGRVPQVCVLFGPSAAGGAYVPAFCDLVVMVEGRASMSLGSPRMAEVVIGEKVSLEQMGGARMHCEVSGCGDVLARTEGEAIETAKAWLRMMPACCAVTPPRLAGRPPCATRPLGELVPADQNKPFDMHRVIEALADEGSFLEVNPLFGK
ncbi:MAG: carboxyl transferase domain-containing protein, partial [Myxococcaceae bacterium]